MYRRQWEKHIILDKLKNIFLSKYSALSKIVNNNILIFNIFMTQSAQ